ncbi:hypothetical protein Q5752_004540 [Cryptotrichosporon argae]
MSPSSPAGSSSSSGGPTSVLLALPDGPVPPSEPASHTLSFIGGYPTFPRVADVVRCGVCHDAVPLLAQVYCPLEGGENDRTLYVWACARAQCQRRDGAVRAFRASVRNEAYVRDVEAKRAEAARIAREEKERARVNPFTMNGDASSALFGSSRPLFGAPAATPAVPAQPDAPAAPDVSALTVSLHTHAPPLPAYRPPQYLSTFDEYLVLPEADGGADSSDDEDDARAPDATDAHGEFGGDDWDKLVPRGVDDVFEQFVRRLQAAEDGAAQVLRYDFAGTPLPYSAGSDVFRRLFPAAPTTRAADNEDVDCAPFYEGNDGKGIVPACKCGGKRVFEMQLVPQLISVLRPETLSTGAGAGAGASAGEGEGGCERADGAAEVGQSEAERKKELERLAKGEAGGMEWGNIMVFGCERDCVGVSEEWVGVEWETQIE